MAGETTLPVPTDESARGITDAISGYVAQNVNVTRAPVRQEYPGQEGAIYGGKEYDERFSLSATVYSASSSRTPPFDGMKRIQFRNQYWVLDDCQEAGTYNDLMRWTVTAHRFTNWPTSAS